MKHKHHILPRHMGGGNEPTNLIEVSVEEHAELHLSLYLTHGHLQDWVAYHMLSGQTTEGERARRQLCSEQMKGNTRGRANKGRKNPWNVAANKARAGSVIWITDGNTSTHHPKNQAIPEGWWRGRVMSEAAKKKMSAAAFGRWSK